jgi:hypothetical protein
MSSVAFKTQTDEKYLGSAKGADARRQTAKELVNPLGGALDAVTVLREFLNSAKGADVRHESGKEPDNSLRGALDTATVLRGFLKRGMLEL